MPLSPTHPFLFWRGVNTKYTQQPLVVITWQWWCCYLCTLFHFTSSCVFIVPSSSPPHHQFSPPAIHPTNSNGFIHPKNDLPSCLHPTGLQWSKKEQLKMTLSNNMKIFNIFSSYVQFLLQIYFFNICVVFFPVKQEEEHNNNGKLMMLVRFVVIRESESVFYGRNRLTLVLNKVLFLSLTKKVVSKRLPLFEQYELSEWVKRHEYIVYYIKNGCYTWSWWKYL